MEGKPIAASHDQSQQMLAHRIRSLIIGGNYKTQFNAGVILMDIDAMEESGYDSLELTKLAGNKENLGVDQDALNVFFKDLTKYLPDKFNYPVAAIPADRPYDGKSISHFVLIKAWDFPLYAEFENYLYNTVGNSGIGPDSSAFLSISLALKNEYGAYKKVNSGKYVFSLCVRIVFTRLNRWFIRRPRALMKILSGKVFKKRQA
jgi:lipopolysaccharide biosynthesis glycosyltransferase